jgi:hypothetical protein
MYGIRILKPSLLLLHLLQNNLQKNYAAHNARASVSVTVVAVNIPRSEKY